jgi:hypothetical protein
MGDGVERVSEPLDNVERVSFMKGTVFQNDSLEANAIRKTFKTARDKGKMLQHRESLSI